jgi:hypothetical protein
VLVGVGGEQPADLGVQGADLLVERSRLLERSGSAWLRRLPTTTRRCSSTQETSGPGRRARNAAMHARNSSGV